MKKFVLWVTGIMLISFGVAFFILPKGLNLSVSNGGKYASQVDQEQSAKLDGITSISITTSSEEINIIPENREDVKVHFSGKFNSSLKNPDLKLIVESFGSEVKIYIDKTNYNVGFFNSNLRVDIYIPSSYSKTLKIATSSADTIIPSIELENFELRSSSGELKAQSIHTNRTDLKTSSGDIEIGSFKGDLNAASSSGKIDINFEAFDNSIDVASSSGDVKLILPSASNFRLHAASSSGDIKCDFPVTVGNTGKKILSGTVGSGGRNINLASSSGDITIVKN